MIVIRLCAAFIFAVMLGCLAFVAWRATRPLKLPDPADSKYGTPLSEDALRRLIYRQ